MPQDIGLLETIIQQAVGNAARSPKQEDALMGYLKRFGKMYRDFRKREPSSGICEVCGEELEVDPESGEEHCPVCENPEE